MLDLNVKEYIVKAVKAIGFKELTEIQKQVIPLVQRGRSVVGTSQTGSGKTHSFLIPLFDAMTDAEEVQLVISAPTRELAEQIYKVANQINDFAPNKYDIRLYTGGTDRQKELRQLATQPQIVIGTPGKLYDFVSKEKKLFVHTARTFVVDEADMTLDDGFIEHLDQMAGMMSEDLQMLVFSATIPVGLEPFLKKYMDNPKFIKIDAEQLSNIKIDHILIPTKYKGKRNLLLQLLDIINPFQAIIFCNTKTTAVELANFMREHGYKVGEMHGDLPVRIRKQMMRRIKNLEFQYIVATDIAARGIDIDDVSHVINFELPSDVEFYVHRTGRTARANKSGVALSFYDYDSYEYLDTLEKRSIKFEFKQIKDGELVEAKPRNQREKKEFKQSALSEASKLVRKKAKVKPGYKKKRQREIKEVAKQLAKRSHNKKRRK